MCSPFGCDSFNSKPLADVDERKLMYYTYANRTKKYIQKFKRALDINKNLFNNEIEQKNQPTAPVAAKKYTQ